MAVKNGGMRMAEERSVTGRSADVVVGQVVGRSGHPGTALAMAERYRSAARGLEVSLSDRFPSLATGCIRDGAIERRGRA